jgi:NAD(P)-dependent dehydrogenase (short-subunit alcohol dehydrogenase family)
MQQLEGRVAVVTGGGSGIGAALARVCGAAGMRVALADVEADAVEGVAASMRDVGMQALSAVVDVRRREDLERLAERTYAEFGACDLLCNNAGVMLNRPLLETSAEDWEWTLSVNLWGVIHGLGVFLPRMKEQRREGHVVNVASIAGITNIGALGLGAYSTSKAAVVMLSEFLRTELETGGIPIGVSVVCPGAVATRIAESERNRPEGLGSGPTAAQAAADPNSAQVAGTQTPIEVAEAILEGVRENHAFILTHPEMKGGAEARSRRLLGAFDEAAAKSS